MSDFRGFRRLAREAALKFLYQKKLQVDTVTNDAAIFIHHFAVQDQSRDFFLQLIAGVENKGSAIDSKIENVAENWKLERMAAVDLSILRIATWELMECPETDYQVVIDEGIELAKQFGNENSASFVNGLLDKLAQEIRKN